MKRQLLSCMKKISDDCMLQPALTKSTFLAKLAAMANPRRSNRAMQFGRVDMDTVANHHAAGRKRCLRR